MSTRWLPLSLGALACAAALGCAAEDRAASERRPTDLPARSFVDPGWRTLFQVGGTEHDSLLQLPFRPVADAAGVALLDAYAKRVLRFDTAGRLLWSFGREGGGPDEFRMPRDLKLDESGRFWVLDPRNARLTGLSADGTVWRRVSLQDLSEYVDDLALVHRDTATLLTTDRNRPIARIAPTGQIVDRAEFPWPRYRHLDPLVSQMITASSTAKGGWVAALQAGDGFWLFEEGRAPVRGWFAEPVPEPRLVRSRTAEGPIVRLEAAAFSAAGVTRSPERIYVLFQGSGPDANRLLDVFSAADGRYLETHLLPSFTNHIAYGSGILYAITSEPYPALVAWRPRDGPLP